MDPDQISIDCRFDFEFMHIDIHVHHLFVVMHENLFEGQVFDGQVGDLLLPINLVIALISPL